VGTGADWCAIMKTIAAYIKEVLHLKLSLNEKEGTCTLHRIQLYNRADGMENLIFINKQPQLSAGKHCSTTTLNCVLTHNLKTKFKEEFYKRICYMRPCHAYYNIQNHRGILIQNLTTIHKDLSLIKVFIYIYFKIYLGLTLL
jgi:chromosome condensin MukBEF MukE localization factor